MIRSGVAEKTVCTTSPTTVFYAPVFLCGPLCPLRLKEPGFPPSRERQKTRTVRLDGFQFMLLPDFASLRALRGLAMKGGTMSGPNCHKFVYSCCDPEL